MFSPGLGDLGIKIRKKSPNPQIPAQNGWKKLFWVAIN
jgi:hypothetical protein